VKNEKTFNNFIKFLFIGLAYLAASYLGNELASLHKTASPVWPASGVAVGSLFIFGLRFWPAILLASIIFNFTKQADYSVAFGITLANILEALLAVLFIKVTGKNEEESSPLKISTSVLLASLLLGSRVGSFIGSGSLIFSGVLPKVAFSEVWLTWFVGDFVGGLVVLPLFLFFKPSYLILKNWEL
jgi:integral membrane sensor domain MASE1